MPGVRLLLLAGLLLRFACAQVPTPAQHFGFTPGDDYKLADYAQLTAYFQKLEKASDRIHLQEFGKTSLGKPMFAAFISLPENLRRLDEYRGMNRKLALGLASPDEAHDLARRGKVFVWIDSGLHADEVAPSQHAPELAYRMLTDDSEPLRRIRENVILIQIPCINPDGLDLVVDWYRKNVGTPYELAPMPWLYQKYSGHDNNRDWFMLNLPETRNVSRLLFQEWFPQIVYNQHQAPPFPARIFVPPYAEPLNPNIPAAVMEGINLIGSAMSERFARENKPGILSYWGFDAWWNGGLRSAPAFHNMHGILTETAGASYATPKTYKLTDLPERFANGNPARSPTVFYERPWMGGKWSVRNAIDYMLTADFAILELAAARSEHFLYKAYDLAAAAMDASRKPFAYVIAPDQWDPWAGRIMLQRLAMSGVRVERATASFKANGKSYAAGTYVLPGRQPFRAYLVDLMDPQKYPELKAGLTGPTKRPYDIAGWTLPMQMGVQVDRVEDAFEAKLADAGEVTAAVSANLQDTSHYLQTMADLKDGKTVRWGEHTIRLPRVAVYEPWTASSDTGWTEWLLDFFNVPYTAIHNEDVRKGDLGRRFDSVIFASQSAASILAGTRSGERSARVANRDEDEGQQRPEYTGGIGTQGVFELEQFVEAGGSLIAFDQATELPLQQFSLPVHPLLHHAEGGRETEAPAGGYYCPGSLLRITVDTANPIATGMPKEAIAFSSGGQAFDIRLLEEHNKGDREIRTVARYATANLLASGWLSGESVVLGQPILVDARHGQGHVILFGFRPQFRGQSFGTFKLVLNAVFLASEGKATSVQKNSGTSSRK